MSLFVPFIDGSGFVIRTDSDLKFNSLIQWFIRSGQHLTNVEDYQAIRQQAYTESLTLAYLSHN